MPVNVQNIYDFLDAFAPFSTAEGWDNCGLQVGDMAANVDRVGVALDVTLSIIEQAKQAGIGLLISHHPALFHPQYSLPAQSPVYQLAVAGIHLISAHSNLDTAPGGVNDVLAEALGLLGVRAIDTPGCTEPLLRIGQLPAALSPAEFAAFTGQKLGCAVQYCAGSEPVRAVAVCGGAGGDYYSSALAQGAHAYVTGEARYHEQLDAAQAGLTLVTAGHFATEYPVVPALAARLRNAFPDLSVRVLAQENPIFTIT